MAASDPTISDWKKINEEFQSKLNRIKTAYDNLESRMESYQLDMSERERAIIELQLDNDGLSQQLNKYEQAITELKLDNNVLKDHNQELSKKISDYEVLISQLKESDTRLNMRSRLNSSFSVQNSFICRVQSKIYSIAVEDQELNKRKKVFQWTLQNRGCKEAWLIAKLFKRQGFSNAWIPAEGYKMCQNCCAKKKENQCIILRQYSDQFSPETTHAYGYSLRIKKIYQKF